MHLTDIRAYALSSPIEPPQQRQFHGGVRRLRKRDVVLVVIETADGYQGVATAGATSSAMKEYFDGDSHGTFADILEAEVADALEGESLDDIDDAHDTIEESNLPAELTTKSISAVDIALYDIRGKEVGAPVYELLREEFANAPEPTLELPLYASAGMYMEPDGYAEQATLVEDAGFFGYKYRPGIGPEEDLRTIDLVTDSVEDTEVMLDAHTWWKLEQPYGDDQITEIVTYADQCGAYWIEEPVAPDDYAGYRRLAETGATLAGGESEESPDGLRALADTGAVSFLQGDVRHHRGFTGCIPAIERCRGTDIEFVPHNFGTWIGLLANAHLVAAGPEVELVEYPIFENDPILDVDGDPGMYPFDLAFDLTEGEPPVTDGHLTLPDDPGLGFDLNPDVIDRYPYIEGPWTEFSYE